MRDCRGADGGYHLSAALDDRGMLGFRSDHEACYVLKENYWGVLLVAEFYESRSLSCFIGIDHRCLVCDDADSMTYARSVRGIVCLELTLTEDGCKSCYQITPVFGLESQVSRVVYDSDQDFPHVECPTDVWIDERHKVVRRVTGRKS
jgi:hypothetical protein